MRLQRKDTEKDSRSDYADGGACPQLPRILSEPARDRVQLLVSRARDKIFQNTLLHSCGVLK